MGCGGSKLDGLEAVALCRGRSDHLEDAIRHRYALAAAHAAYAASLRSVGASLQGFLLDGGGGVHDPLPPSFSPVLPLPTRRKGDAFPIPSPPPAVSAASPPHSHSHSHSGSHIHFHSNDEGSDTDADADVDSPLHSGGSSPLHYYPNPTEALGPTYFNSHYARSQPPVPSVPYEQRPPNPETVRFNSAEPSSYGYPYATQNPSLSPYSDPYLYPPNHYSYSGMGGFVGPSSPPAYETPPPPVAAAAASTGPSSSSSKPPPPPPSPPRTSTWDFLNPFASYGSYYPSYTPSRSSKEVREEEGIPDLEEEVPEVVKEAYVDRKFAASMTTNQEEYSSRMPSSSDDDDDDDDRVSSYEEDLHYRRPKAVHRSKEGKAGVVEKKVAHEEPQSVAAPHRCQDVSTVSSEIKAQFDIASGSALELSRMLELGKRSYHQNYSTYEAPSRMMYMMTPPSSSREGLLNCEEDMVSNSRSLSSTLEKLYMWEKKLYHEVKAEEKMRLLHDKTCKRLKHLDERGAEAHKIDFTQGMIRKLSTKIRIAIQVVDSISKKINKLRDEELWPQISEIIHGLMRMWRVMLECQRAQCQTISEFINLDSVSSGGRLSDTCRDALMQFELELLRWIGNFSDWINAQKNYVKALNGWLILCLHYEPEVTPDGIPPYSPGRIGAPPVFVICHHWSQAMEGLCEKDVVDAIQAFATNVRHLWEQQDVEPHQKLMENREMERWLKDRGRDAQTIHKEVDALRKKLVLVPDQNGLPLYGHGGPPELSSLQLGLKQIFEAMENFAASSVKAYEEIHLCSKEEAVARENTKVP